MVANYSYKCPVAWHYVFHAPFSMYLLNVNSADCPGESFSKSFKLSLAVLFFILLVITDVSRDVSCLFIFITLYSTAEFYQIVLARQMKFLENPPSERNIEQRQHNACISSSRTFCSNHTNKESWLHLRYILEAFLRLLLRQYWQSKFF